MPTGIFTWREKAIAHKTAVFRHINRDRMSVHHNALEFPDGETVLPTSLREGQEATVRQLPAEPKSIIKSAVQRRVAYAG